MTHSGRHWRSDIFWVVLDQAVHLDASWEKQSLHYSLAWLGNADQPLSIDLTCERLCVLEGLGSYAVTFADLFHCELPPADAASPARGRRLRDPTHWLAIGTSGCYEFATAVRTLTLDHKSYPQ